MPIADTAVLTYMARRQSRPAKLFLPPVPTEEELRDLLTIALRVPDHGKLEPWRLVLIDKPAMARLADLAEARARDLGGDAEMIAKGRGQYDLGHLAVAVIASPKPVAKIPEVEQMLSAGALCMNIVHAATASGWAASWLTGWPAHDAVFAAEAFGCTEAERVAGVIHIGTCGTEMVDRPRPELDRLLSRA